jgi:hypothetical protein
MFQLNAQIYLKTQIYLARVQMDPLFVVALSMRRSHMIVATFDNNV